MFLEKFFDAPATWRNGALRVARCSAIEYEYRPSMKGDTSRHI
jgi:hypothetical protein